MVPQNGISISRNTKTMTRSNLYRTILPQLVNYLMAKNIITEEEKNNVEDFFDLTQYELC